MIEGIFWALPMTLITGAFFLLLVVLAQPVKWYQAWRAKR